MVVNFYHPSPSAPLVIRWWKALLKPSYTHCNIELDGFVYDLGTGAPTVTSSAEAHKLRRVRKRYFCPDVAPDVIWDMADLKPTLARSALWVLGCRWLRPVNCASFCSDILRHVYPDLPGCYTPDLLEKALGQYRSDPGSHQEPD